MPIQVSYLSSQPSLYIYIYVLLRMYPPHFGLRLVKLFPQLIASRSDPPEIPAKLANMDTQSFFDSLSWNSDCWEDGNLVSALAYLRGNKSLNLKGWRSSFPEYL